MRKFNEKLTQSFQVKYHRPFMLTLLQLIGEEWLIEIRGLKLVEGL